MKTPTPTQMIKLSEIEEPPQPDRFTPGNDNIEELAQSIAEHGLINAVTVTKQEGPKPYLLIAGHRRLLAHRALGRAEIEAKILVSKGGAVAELRLVENMFRQDLSPLEEAVALKRWRDESGLTQEQAAAKIGKGISWVKKRESLLALPDDLMEAVHDGSINPSVALELRRIEDDSTRKYYLQNAVEFGATQDVVNTWAMNYERERQAQTPEQLNEAAQSYQNATQNHVLPCHACGQTHPIQTLKNVFLCPEDYTALQNATRQQ